EHTRDLVNREAEKLGMTQAEYLSDLMDRQVRKSKAEAINSTSCSDDDKVATIGDIKKILAKGVQDIAQSNKGLIERREKSNASLKSSIDANTAVQKELMKIIKGEDHERKDPEQGTLF
ncbi:MAG: hypothetical protein IKW20_07370, partial [Bacteroidales bacterium]|nr:hypothetical protein [Bacteroidales bacterium]